MNFKRGIPIAVFLWLVIFIIDIIYIAITNDSNPMSFGSTMLLVILWTVLGILASFFYFRGRNVEVSPIQGIYLGLLFFIASTLLDLAFSLPYFISGGDFSTLQSYYFSPLFITTLLLQIAIPTILGTFYKGRRRGSSSPVPTRHPTRRKRSPTRAKRRKKV